MNLMLMHSAFIAALAVLGHGLEVSGQSGLPIATPPMTVGGGDKTVALAIDGGGLRGILSASILKRVEKSIQYQTQDKNRTIGESFDIIAGTSTGGILATYFSAPVRQSNGELKLNGTAAGAIDFYRKNAQKIFGKPPNPVMRTLGRVKIWGFKPLEVLGLALRAAVGWSRHSGLGLDRALEETLPADLTFSKLAKSPHSAKVRNPSLFLVSYDVKYRRPVAFVADRSMKKTYFLRQEGLGVPFSAPFESTIGNFTRLFPGDKNRRYSVVKRWINRFKCHGEFYDKQTCTEGFVKRWYNWVKSFPLVKRIFSSSVGLIGSNVAKSSQSQKALTSVDLQNCAESFKFGPVNFLGDVQMLRDDVADKWQVLQGRIFDKTKSNGDKPDAMTKDNYVCFAKTNLDDLKVWEAARASSSAPTFLPAMEIENFYRRDWNEASEEANDYCNDTAQMEPGFFCDGGIVANNPGLQALLYLMAHDQSMSVDTDTADTPKNDSNARYEYNNSEEVDCDDRLQTLPKDWEEYNRIAFPNPLDNYALLSIGSGSTFDSANVDSMAGSELWWINQGAQSGNLISLLMDNLQMIAHTNLRTLFTLAGRENAYLRIQYRTKHVGVVPEHFDESLEKMDDPSDFILKDYEDLGNYVADIYAGLIDQFVFLHILKKEERDIFIKEHSATAEEVFNGIPIADDELDSWKSKIPKAKDGHPKDENPGSLTPIMRTEPEQDSWMCMITKDGHHKDENLGSLSGEYNSNETLGRGMCAVRL